MSWYSAIEANREKLARIVAELVAMAGFKTRAELAAAAPTSPQEAAPQAGPTTTPQTSTQRAIPKPDPFIPRSLYKAVLRILRPAEAAARRLIVALARDLPAPKLKRRKFVAPPPQDYSNYVVYPVEVLKHVLITMPPDALRRIGPDGDVDAMLVPKFRTQPPPPARKKCARRGETPARARSFSFALVEPLKDPVRLANSRFPATFRQRPCKPIPMQPLARRMRLLSEALDDLPAQARRYARWRACRNAALAERKQGARRKRNIRLSALRPGYAPGRLSANARNRLPVHDILSDAQYFAREAGEKYDTS